MHYDALVIAAHADDAETQMGGTLAKLADRGHREGSSVRTSKGRDRA
jgi:LmbE family N-acetylglucosaminyl deacetylase